MHIYNFFSLVLIFLKLVFNFVLLLSYLLIPHTRVRMLLAQGEHAMMTWQAGGMHGAYYGYGVGAYGIPQGVQPPVVQPLGPPPYTDPVYPTGGSSPF